MPIYPVRHVGARFFYALGRPNQPAKFQIPMKKYTDATRPAALQQFREWMKRHTHRQPKSAVRRIDVPNAYQSLVDWCVHRGLITRFYQTGRGVMGKYKTAYLQLNTDWLSYLPATTPPVEAVLHQHPETE